MARRFDKYRVKTGDLIDEAFLNVRFQDVDVRIADVEDTAKDWSTEAAKLREAGLARVSEALDPVLSAIERRANLGAILTAESDSDIDASEGTKVFQIRAQDRAQFAPAAHLSVWKTADPSIAMLGRTLGYDPETGALTFLAEQFAGAGFHTGWTISVANSVSTLTEAQIATAKAREAIDAAKVAVINRDEAVTAADTSLRAKDDVGEVVEAVELHRAAVEQARNEAEAFMKRYQGAHATNPSTRLDGSALQRGDWYLNTASFEGEGDWRWWTGTAWRSRQVPSDSTVVSFEGRAGAVTAQDGDYHAGEVVFTPSGGLVASRVQAALVELDAKKQAISALLTSVAAIATNGILAKSGAGTAVARTIGGTTNEVTVANGDGVAGNPTIALVKTTQPEAEAGDDNNKAMTALRTKQAIAVQVPAASETVAGRVRLATEVEGLAGIEVGRAPSVYVVKKMLDQLRNQLTAGAGAALDTFEELAAALGNDPNFATSVTTAIGTKLSASAVSAYMMTLLDDGNAANARATLELGALALLASVGTTSLDNDAVTNAKLANMPANTLKGVTTAGDPLDLTAAQVRTLLTLGGLALKSTIVTGDISDGHVTFAKLAAAAIATKPEAEAGLAADKLLTVQGGAEQIAALSGGGVKTTVFDIGGTFVKDPKAKKILVRGVGAGGGGGGTTNNAGARASGGWGAVGGEALFDAADVPASVSITIGAGGTGGSSSGGNGGSGGSTSFGGLFVLPGGPGGQGGSGAAVRASPPAAATISSLASFGYGMLAVLPDYPDPDNVPMRGLGSLMGIGGAARTSQNNGIAGTGYGAGGGGAYANLRTGGAGTDGLLVVEERF
ncbi:hypothetical protein [Kaistia granuli]|uniref:hypothetical protein n=1 Tax=Kaistia granuli TaxID=363259 RepID=UPI000380ABB6|nr:hypothetical protein [Kaistia granuli]